MVLKGASNVTMQDFIDGFETGFLSKDALVAITITEIIEAGNFEVFYIMPSWLQQEVFSTSQKLYEILSDLLY